MIEYALLEEFGIIDKMCIFLPCSTFAKIHLMNVVIDIIDYLSCVLDNMSCHCHFSRRREKEAAGTERAFTYM